MVIDAAKNINWELLKVNLSDTGPEHYPSLEEAIAVGNEYSHKKFEIIICQCCVN